MIEIKSPCRICSGEVAIGSIGEEGSGFTNKIYVYVDQDDLRIFNEEFPGFAGNVHISYCPACGRRLEAKHDEAV